MKVKVKLLSCVQLCVTPWSVARQAPLSMGFSWQEYWSGLLCPPPGDLPDPGIEPMSLISPALAGGFSTFSATWEDLFTVLSWFLFFCMLRHCNVQLCVTPWSVARQAPLSMGFSWQEHWSRLPCPPPAHLPNLEIKPVFPMSPALVGGFFTMNTTWEA